MKGLRKTIIKGLMAVFILDVFGSLTSTTFNFDYTSLIVFSYLIYGFFGFQAYRATQRLKHSVIVGLTLGLFDATIGWWISFQLYAKVDGKQVPDEFLTTSLVIIMVTIVAIFFAVIGGFISKKLAKRSVQNASQQSLSSIS